MSNSPFPHLFQPLSIGNFTVRNRIVNTTHGGGAEERYYAYLRERARGGVALMGTGAFGGIINFTLGPGQPDQFAGDFSAMPLDPTTPKGVAFYDRGIVRLRKIGEVIHAEGAKCFGQVAYLGLAGHRDNLHPTVAPSSDFLDTYEAYTPHEATVEEIEQLIFCYAQGIRRVREAGLDAAEIHGAHGYFITQLFSPRFNTRTDKYGGSVENRSRFVLELIDAARRLVGADFPIGIRVGLDGDGEHGGITPDQLAAICRVIAPRVAWVNVSGGTYTGLGDGHELAYVSPWYVQPAQNLTTVRAIKKATADHNTLVFATGRIADVALAESILAEGAADMIGMVRALIADPELPKKAMEGRPDDIRMCLGMNECHYVGPERKPFMMCAVNAAAGREDEMQILPAPQKKTVVVVGAGPAGMEAARVLGLRGHKVFLCDRERSLGGTVRTLALDPNRRNLNDMTVFFERELKRAGVELLLGEEVDAGTIEEMGPDAVVVATGARPYLPRIPGVTNANVATSLQVLRGEAKLGRRVLVVSGQDKHLGGPTLAEFAADQGAEVELISENPDFAHGAEDPTRYLLMKRLMNKNVRISLVCRLAAVNNSAATILQTFTRQERTEHFDTVVLACGSRSEDRLARDLKGKVKELQNIGDSLGPRRIINAVLEGARAGRAI